MNNSTSRREFLQKSSLAALGIMAFPSFAKRVAISDKVRVAHIGLGGMGNSHLNWFSALPEVDVVGICDLDSDHLNATAKKYSEKYPDRKLELFDDFRRVLDRKDIDAITVATPDHWHAQVAIMAFQAGKDVYGEKPLSYSVKEGQMMLAAQKKYNKIFQLGTQIHAGDNYHRVQEIIKSGVLGKIKTVRLWKTGLPPVLGPSNYQKPPTSLNYDMWLGPAPYHEYSPERVHFNYRYFLDYSGGIFQDFWCHIADVVWMSINPQNLKKVSAKGEKSEGVADAPKTIDIKYEFEDLDLYWSSTAPNVPGAATKGIGAYFEGEKGTLLCDYNTKEITINNVVMLDVPEVPISIIRSPGHQQNFIDAVKSRNQPESNLEYARKMTLPMHLGLISYRLGKPLSWNSETERFVKSRKANKLLWRSYRKPWNLI